MTDPAGRGETGLIPCALRPMRSVHNLYWFAAAVASYRTR
jgi:hypothetical protein